LKLLKQRCFISKKSQKVVIFHKGKARHGQAWANMAAAWKAC